MSTEKTITVHEAAQMLGTNKNDLYRQLVKMKVVTRCANRKGYLVTELGRQNNLVRSRIRSVNLGALQKEFSQILITSQGMDWIQEHRQKTE